MNLAKRKRQFPSKSKAITVRGALSAQELRFIDELLLDLDPEAAAYRAGFRPAERGRVLITKPAIRGAVQLALQRRSIRSEAQADEVLRLWWVLARADARELSHIRRVNCRHCYGLDHRYQFTQDELRRAQQDHEILQRKLPESQRRPFDDLGGEGYDGTKGPSSDCTECFGEGVLSVFIADSRTYSEAAALLFDGVEVSNEGSIKVKHRDRQHAMEMAAKHLGMFVNRNVNLNLDPAQLADLVSKMPNEQFEEVLSKFEQLASRNAKLIEGDKE